MRSLVSIALAVALGFSPVLQGRALADDTSEAITVQPGDVGGSIVDLDGKTPIKGATVQLLDKDGKVVAQGATDEKGAFALGKQANGSYTINLGNATGKLVVKEGAQASSLKVVLDPKVALGKKDEKDEKVGATKVAMSTTAAVVTVIGATVVVAAAGAGIGYGIYSSHHRDRKNFFPISP